MALDHDWFGLPGGRFQSDGGLRSTRDEAFERLLLLHHTGWLKTKYPTGEYAISPQPVV